MLKKYRQALLLSWKDLYRHPIIFLGIFALLIGFLICITIVSKLGLGMAGGFISGMLQVVALTFYFNWLNYCQAPRGIKFKDLPEFNSALFTAVINVAFVLFISDLMLQSFWDSPLKAIVIGLNLIVVICFNPLPEIINKHQYQGLTSFSEALDFMKKRGLEWLPLIILPIIPILLLTPKMALIKLAISSPLMPFIVTLKNFEFLGLSFGVLPIIPLIIFAHWIMLFRRRLYDQIA